jgi:hypothetical protein
MFFRTARILRAPMREPSTPAGVALSKLKRNAE